MSNSRVGFKLHALYFKAHRGKCWNGKMPTIILKASTMKTLRQCPARRRSSRVSYLKLIVKERANMVVMLTYYVHSAHSGDLKRSEDNKLQQISAARELLKLGGSLGYKFN